MRTITVRQDDKGGYEVLEGERTSGQLCFGEMLEQVTRLLPPPERRPYEMRTEPEWAERLNRRNTSKQE